MNPIKPASKRAPRFEAPKRASPRAAFTLIELLVIVSLLGLLVVIQWPALAKATHQTTRAQCAANLRQVTMAFHIYATENIGKLPSGTVGFWAWDIPWDFATTLGKYGAPRNTLYCPANPGQNLDPLWNYVANNYRVIDYALTLVGGGSISSSNQNATLTPQSIPFGPGIYPPPLASQRVLLADATLSQPGQDNEAIRNSYNYTRRLPSTSAQFACRPVSSGGWEPCDGGWARRVARVLANACAHTNGLRHTSVLVVAARIQLFPTTR